MEKQHELGDACDGISLGKLAEFLGARLRGDAGVQIFGLATLKNAGSRDLSFLSNAQYRSLLEGTQAAAVILSPSVVESCQSAVLFMDDPYWGYARVSQIFAPSRSNLYAGPERIHSSAQVSSEAIIDPSVQLGANAVIEKGAVIGAGTVIGAGCVIGAYAKVGNGCLLHSNVTLYHHVTVGNDTAIHSGAVIGADGFGYAPHEGKWEKIAQLGSVIVGNGVEIGANTTVDRGALEDTVIGDYVIIDNQVQIAHNVIIGAGTAVAGCTAIAGSVTIGRYCTIAGAVAIAGHIDIADHVHVSGMSLVSKSLNEAGSYSSGTGGVMKTSLWQKNAARFRQLSDIAKRISKLETGRS